MGFKFLKSKFDYDFFRPIILPIIICAALVLSIYIGGNYYYSNFIVKAKEIIEQFKKNPESVKKYIDHISYRNKIHYYVNITLNVIQLTNQIILLIGILIFVFFKIKLVVVSYYFQMLIMSVLFALGAFLSLAIPDIQTSLIENFYFKSLRNNLDDFFLNKVTPIALIVSYGLIYSRNNIVGSKSIDSSIYHTITLFIILSFLIARNVYYIYNAMINLNTLELYSNKLKGTVDVVDKLKEFSDYAFE